MLRVSAVKELPALSRIGDTDALDCEGPSDDRRVADAPGADWSRVVVDRRKVAIYRDTFNRKSRGCLGGSVMLVKSRRVRQRRLRPQAGCQIQPFHYIRLMPPQRFGCHTSGPTMDELSCRLRKPNVVLTPARRLRRPVRAGPAAQGCAQRPTRQRVRKTVLSPLGRD
jgi:hypothetical protein